jgi:hypothetical protein
MTHHVIDQQTVVHDVTRHQATDTLAAHRAPELEGFATFASLRLWAVLALERQRHGHSQGSCSLGSLAGQPVESKDNTRADLAKGFRQWNALFVDGLAEMRTHRDLTRDADPVTLAYVLRGAMQRGMLLTQTLRDTGPLEAAFDSAGRSCRRVRHQPDRCPPCPAASEVASHVSWTRVVDPAVLGRVYDPIDQSRYRVLVDGLWPRGLVRAEYLIRALGVSLRQPARAFLG